MKFWPFILVASGAASVFAPPAADASVMLTMTRGSRIARPSAYYAPSPLAGVRREMSAAQLALGKATAAATQGGAMADELKAAQAAVSKARQDYVDALAAARQQLGKDPRVRKLQTEVREIETRLNEQRDATVRLSIAADLMVARNAMNTAEWEFLGVDPDLAVTKAAIGDAANALKDVQARRQSAVQQDPTVAAAHQRVEALRRQLAIRR